ncbi:helicase associated domain-containing protein [Ruminococcus sp.]|uniref:helicase associated domain-containing protein n=1 Tax=Ruminococcus sp. TaxID=41978 RepID=UPI0025EBA516|nr:helicase associated domain-containing protein [Ruminococcus sp.]
MAKKYRACKVYYQVHHDLNVAFDYIDENGISIGKWLYTQREGYQTGKISQERIDLLNQIGMIW